MNVRCTWMQMNEVFLMMKMKNQVDEELMKTDGYTFLIKLVLICSMSSWKEFQLSQILNTLSVKHLIKLNLTIID